VHSKHCVSGHLYQHTIFYCACTVNRNFKQVENRLNEKNYIREKFYIGKKIGEGAFSKVFLGIGLTTDVSRTPYHVAIKKVNKVGVSKNEIKELRHEVDILRIINHPNVVSCLDFYEECDQFYIVLDYVTGGELFTRIVEKEHYSEKAARDITKQILLALDYIHDLCIAHR
jgi:serine/threonine protein kinase